MEVPPEIVTWAVIGGSTLLLGNSGALGILNQKLSSHIKDEEENQKTLEGVKKRLRRVERKLPNGEIPLMYKMIKDMYVERNGSLGKFEAEALDVERKCRAEDLEYEREMIGEVFGDVETK